LRILEQLDNSIITVDTLKTFKRKLEKWTIKSSRFICRSSNTDYSLLNHLKLLSQYVMLILWWQCSWDSTFHMMQQLSMNRQPHNFLWYTHSIWVGP